MFGLTQPLLIQFTITVASPSSNTSKAGGVLQTDHWFWDSSKTMNITKPIINTIFLTLI